MNSMRPTSVGNNGLIGGGSVNLGTQMNGGMIMSKKRDKNKAIV